MNNYIKKVKSLIDNYYLTTFPVDFKLESGTYGYDDYIEGDSLFVCGRCNHLRNELLNPDFYKVGNKHIKTNDTFHNKELVDFLKTYKRIESGNLNDALKSNKKVIVEMEMHGIQEHKKSYSMFRKIFFDKIFKDNVILEKVKSGNLFLFLYYGWEADDFTKHERPDDKYKNWYDMFRSVMVDYNLPLNSIIIAQSSLVGYEREKNYDFNGVKPKVIYDNITEFIPLKSIARNNKFNVNYTIEEHFENLKKSKHTLLRIHRTWHPYRDAMLYYLYKNNYQNKSLIEHREFEKECIWHHKNLFGDKVDENILEKIKKDIPIKSSDYEKNMILEKEHHISNEPIDNLVYENSFFSWVSPSLPDKRDYIFINQSTFSPILHYHPILWFGHTNIIKYFKQCGFKSFDWLFDESYDTIDSDLDKFKHNIKEVDKIMNMDKKSLIDLMWDNREILQHNRNLLLECKSIERILTKLYEILNETEI